MRSNKVYCFRAYYSKGVSHHHLCLADTQSSNGKGKLHSGKREGCRYALTGGFWHEEAVEAGHPI